MTVCIDCGRARALRAFGLCSTCYLRMRREAIEAGKWETIYVPAGPTLDHLQALKDAGYGSRLIAHLSGVSSSTIWRIGDQRNRVAIDTEERILAVPVTSLWTLWRTVDYSHRMPAGPVVRRLRALAADGWTHDEISEAIGWHRSLVGRYLTRPPAWTLSETTRMVDRVYRSDRFLVPIREAPKATVLKGWPRPLEWDDIDDESSQQFARRRSMRRAREAGLC